MRLWRGFVLVLMVAGCGKPPPQGLADFYARRADLRGLDVSALGGRRIVIDPGHGGAFAGSRGVADTREADVNLGVALYLWGLLRDAGADVHLTRTSDRDLLPANSDALRDDLAARVAVLDSLQPDVFLSLHHNSNAQLDRERNAIETYFRLDDTGPSYDLARAIHRRLAGVLGIQEGALRPGNYYVLRHADMAAVLGEASYLSNPAVESKLQLAEKQLLEAEAYFLGLVDYFSRGVPRVVERAGRASLDTLRTGESVHLHIESSLPLEPSSVQLRVDGHPWPFEFDAASGVATLHAEPSLEAGVHEIELSARNVRGNAARAWRQRLNVYAPPALLLYTQHPDPAAPGSDARIDVRVLDAWNRPVADGDTLRFAVSRADLLHADTTTRAGNARAYVRATGAAMAHLDVVVGGLAVRVPLHVEAGAPSQRLLRCEDAAQGTPLANVEVHCGWGSRQRSDVHGMVLVPSRCDSITARQRGYVTWRGGLGAGNVLKLAPLYGGRLLAVRFVVDAGGDGNAPTEAGLGISEAELSWQVANRLVELLHAAGAEARSTRGAVDVVAELERVRLATQHRADWFVRVESSLQVGRPGRVLHYPGSRGGEFLARAVARQLRAAIGDSIQVSSDARYVLQQTPCPAIVVQLPGPRVLTARAAVAHADSLRRAANTLLLGLRTALTPDIETWPPLEARGIAVTHDALVVLDGVEARRPDARGRVRFEHVAPGTHHLLWLESAAGALDVWVTTNAADTTRVVLPARLQP